MEYKTYYKSPVGIFEIVVKENILVALSLTDKIQQNNIDTKFTTDIKKQLDEYFSKKRKFFDIKIKPHGTDFQKKVWNELMKIPYGKTKSYSEIAENIGCASTFRAVGNACNKNPIMLIIPCHRIIAKSGNLSGFACGTDIKEKLLNLENL